MPVISLLFSHRSHWPSCSGHAETWIQSPTGLHSHSHGYVWYLSPARFRVLTQQQLVYEREVEAARLITPCRICLKFCLFLESCQIQGTPLCFTYIGLYYGLCCRLSTDTAYRMDGMLFVFLTVHHSTKPPPLLYFLTCCS